VFDVVQIGKRHTAMAAQFSTKITLQVTVECLFTLDFERASFSLISLYTGLISSSFTTVALEKDAWAVCSMLVSVA